MRLPTTLRTIAVLAAVATVFAVTRAESTRIVRAELTAQALGHFAVENLAGKMRVAPTAGNTVVVVATVHAENDALAQKTKLEQVVGKGGVPTLRVQYPVEDEFRYPGLGRDHGFLGNMFDGSNTTTEYAGRRVKVSASHGVLLYADVEVQVPRHLENAEFRNMVGSIEGRDLEGRIAFDTSGGDVTLRSMSGSINADTGSGDVKASDCRGSFSCDTGSGDCDLTDFEGEAIHVDVGSGDVTVRHATARLVDVDAGSGDVRVLGSNVEEFRSETGSGDVRLESSGSRLARVAADTGSGDIVLLLSPDASFEAMADQGSGDLIMRFKDAQAIVRHKEVVGYRRGDARIKIDIETGSGDLTIEPGS